jgi:uncharacterized protein involved in outer membrane biogenesis
MKRWLKWVVRLFVLLVLLLAAAVLSMDAILKTVTERRIRAQTGLDARIGRVSVGLRDPMVIVQDIKLFHRSDFAGMKFIEIPELHMEYDRAALASLKLHITLMRFHLAAFNVVRNEAGETNMVKLLAARKIPADAAAPARTTQPLEFAGIDLLELTLDHARFVDLKDARQNREFILTLEDHSFENIKSRQELWRALMSLWQRDDLAEAPTPLPGS